MLGFCFPLAQHQKVFPRPCRTVGGRDPPPLRLLRRVVVLWYVSVVSIIFYCSMPVFYNFHILLATFYTIFGTNILIQCPVPVPVCCMFFVSQNIHIKQSPNAIKTYRDILEYMWILGSGINARRCPRGAPRGEGAPYVVATSGTVSRGFFFPKIIYIPKKSPSIFILFGLRLIWIFCETKNMQQTGTDTGHWINMLVPKIV